MTLTAFAQALRARQRQLGRLPEMILDTVSDDTLLAVYCGTVPRALLISVIKAARTPAEVFTLIEQMHGPRWR